MVQLVLVLPFDLVYQVILACQQGHVRLVVQPHQQALLDLWDPMVLECHVNLVDLDCQVFHQCQGFLEKQHKPLEWN